MKAVKYGFTAALVATGMLIDIAHAQPKVSAANRETMRIMKTIKIPPPYTPVYQPYAWQRYLPSADTTPDYSPKVGPIPPFSIPASTMVVAPSVLPVAATNTTSASATNVPVVDKTVKTPAPVTKEKEKASNLERK